MKWLQNVTYDRKGQEKLNVLPFFFRKKKGIFQILRWSCGRSNGGKAFLENDAQQKTKLHLLTHFHFLNLHQKTHGEQSVT